MQFCTPFRLHSSVGNQMIEQAVFTNDITYGESESSEHFHCYHVAKSPTAEDWTAVYISYPSTKIIVSTSLQNKTHAWNNKQLVLIDLEYQSH